MSTEFKLETDLIVLDQPNALEVFTTPDEVDKIIAMVKAKVAALPPMDATTPKGRKDIASAAFAVAKSKSAIERVGKELAAELKELPKKVDAGRRRFEQALDELRDQVRKPLSDYEASETARIKVHEDRILAVRAIANEAALHRSDVETLKAMLAAAEAVDLSPAATEEFADDYRLAKEAALHNVRAAITTRTKYDADQAELARLRAAEAERQALEAAAAAERARVEREERIAREATEKAQREAQAAADRAVREAQERVDREARAAADRIAEADARAEQARRDQERERQEAEDRRRAEQRRKDDEAAEAARRAADVEHRRKINSAARDAFMNMPGITKPLAEALVSGIAHGLIPHVKIDY